MNDYLCATIFIYFGVEPTAVYVGPVVTIVKVIIEC